MPGDTVAEVLATACARYGERFEAVLRGSRVWLNGEPATDAAPVTAADEVAVLPPVSGGATGKLRTDRAGKRRDSPATSAKKPADDGPDGPHVRLGLAWAVLTTTALTAGAPVLAVWSAATAGLAAAQTARTWRKKSERPDIAAAAGGAALVNVGAAGGPIGAVAGLVAAAGAAFLRPGNQVRTLTIGAAVGAAAAAPVALRTQGFAHAFVLLALVWAYDSGNYVVGTGAGNRWEGPVAGIASVGAVSLAVAVLFAPPFEGALPWAFGALVAVTAPMGEHVADRLLGDRDARVPVLRRIDSLLVAGPAFAALGAVVL